MFRGRGAQAGATADTQKDRLEPPPPGQMTDMDYHEVSPVEWPANGRMFFVRKGIGFTTERLTQEQYQEIVDAGMEAPLGIQELVKTYCQEFVDALGIPFKNQATQEEEEEGEPMQGKTKTQKSGDQAPGTQQGQPDANSGQGAEQDVVRELTDADLAKVAEVAAEKGVEAAMGIVDERFQEFDQRLAALEGAGADDAEDDDAGVEDTQKSYDDLDARLKHVESQVSKGEFRPGGQDDGERGDAPPSDEEIHQQQVNKGWEDILSPKKGA